MKVLFQKQLSIFSLLILIHALCFVPETLCKTEKKRTSGKTIQTQSSQKTVEPARAHQPLSTSQGGLQCDARSAVLMDGLTGEILYEQNPEVTIPPARFAKILTLYLAFDAIRDGQLKMEERVTVSEKAWRTQGSKMFIKVGERVTVEDLIKGIAIVSGNDACIALAEHIAGSEEVFASKMNEKAKAIGMKNSHFKNSHGMPAEGQLTTAFDMAILSKRYIEDHPEALAIHSTTEFEYNGIRQGNRNVLLQKNIGVDGLKTGHIEESGYHLVATAKRDGQRMIAVVMGCDRVGKRAPEAQKLLEYGFKNFSTVEAVKKGHDFGPIRVKRGKSDQVRFIASDSVFVTVPKGKENLVSAVPQLPEFVTAPIQKGQVLAKVLVQKDGQKVKEIDLLASTEIEKSLIPPWPVLIGGVVGILIFGLIGFWFIRRPQRRKI